MIPVIHTCPGNKNVVRLYTKLTEKDKNTKKKHNDKNHKHTKADLG